MLLNCRQKKINEDVFYRLLTGVFYYNGAPRADCTCYVVESLPSEGIPVTNDMVHVVLYYAVNTASVFGYISSALSGAMGVPAGWYPVEVLGQAFGLAWGGIIWNAHEDPIDGANRLLLSYSLYQFKREWDNISERVGWKSSEGVGAEIFNSLKNSATGNSSHAEGYSTTASGNYSHAEGLHTVAAGRNQHVQGRSNIIDENGMYAHIVGNGSEDLINGEPIRSNAHTLDWNGLGWFAGGLKVGGTGKDDPNAEEILTKPQIQAMIDEAIAKLNL